MPGDKNNKYGEGSATVNVLTDTPVLMRTQLHVCRDLYTSGIYKYLPIHSPQGYATQSDGKFSPIEISG